MECQRSVPCDDVKEDVMAQRVPVCQACGDGVMKPGMIYIRNMNLVI